VIPEELERYGVSKELFVLVPLLASVTGVTFDVGYFYGININYFTLFSLSEHLVFAMEALPIALLWSLIAVVGIMYWDGQSIRRWIADLEAKAAGGPVVKERPPGALERALMKKWTFSVLAGGMAILWLYLRQWATGALFVLLFIGDIISIFWIEVLLSRRVLLAYGSLAVLTVSFAMGYQKASEFLAVKTANDTLQVADSALQGNIIRTGDRGVLLYVPSSNQIMLLKWDQIKQISRVAK
jgi:hypothetical protein